MTGKVENCTVNVHPGPSDAQVGVVQGLQELLMKQLDILGLAHKNLEPAKGDIIGINMTGADNGQLCRNSIQGADIGINLENVMGAGVFDTFINGRN